jgi:hypothetical protein
MLEIRIRRARNKEVTGLNMDYVRPQLFKSTKNQGDKRANEWESGISPFPFMARLV